jgi:hypothetical protein
VKSFSHEYTVAVLGGHLILRHDAQVLLLDTGSPVSVGRGSPWRFLGRDFPIQSRYNGMTTEELSETLGTQIDVLLGADVLAQFRVTIDTETSRVAFGDDEWLAGARVLPLHTVGGLPVVDVSLAGRSRRMLLHTGATVSCLASGDTGPYPCVGTARDFYPGLGEFATELRVVPITFGSHTDELECGSLPTALERALLMVGVHGLVGTNLLRSFKLGWSPGFHEMRLLRHTAAAALSGDSATSTLSGSAARSTGTGSAANSRR